MQQAMPHAPTLLSLPEDVVMMHLVPYLRHLEVITGLSALCSTMRATLLSRFEVAVEVLPFKAPRWHPAWGNVRLLRLRESVWGCRGVRMETFLEDIRAARKEKEKEEGQVVEQHGVTIMEIKTRLRQLRQRQACSLECFDLTGICWTRIKVFVLEGLVLEESELKLFGRMAATEVLEFEGCSFRTNLDIFPPQLKELHITVGDAGGRACLGRLPDTLQVLKCENFEFVGKCPFLPPGLVRLEISRLYEYRDREARVIPFVFTSRLSFLKVSNLEMLEIFPILPSSLESIEVARCPSLTTFTNLPSRLQILKITYCQRLFRLALPVQLEEFECYVCDAFNFDLLALPLPLKRLAINVKTENVLAHLSPRLRHLQDLTLRLAHTMENFVPPLTLQSFTLWMCDIDKLPELPSSLQVLGVKYVRKLTNLGPLPISLKTLLVEGCGKMERLENFPPNLTTLRVRTMTSLCYLPKVLPASLDTLEIVDCSSLAIVFECLPPTLRELKIEDVSNAWTSIPPFPSKVRSIHLKMSGLASLPGGFPNCVEKLKLCCESILQYPPFPPQLETLDLSNCTQLNYIAVEDEHENEIGIRWPFPKSLKRLYINDCTELKEVGILPPRLRILALKACKDNMILRSLTPYLRFLFSALAVGKPQRGTGDAKNQVGTEDAKTQIGANDVINQKEAEDCKDQKEAEDEKN